MERGANVGTGVSSPYFGTLQEIVGKRTVSRRWTLGRSRNVGEQNLRDQFLWIKAEEVASPYSGDVPSQQEAVGAAIAAHAKAIVSSTPDPGSLTKVIAKAHAANIPVILMNTDDKTSGRDAYVGCDLVSIGQCWAHSIWSITTS